MNHDPQILERLERIESLLAQLAGRALDAKPVPDLIVWRAVASRLGIEGRNPARAAAKRIGRARDGGARLRVSRHGVNSIDFKKWIAEQESARPSVAETVRAALRPRQPGRPAENQKNGAA